MNEAPHTKEESSHDDAGMVNSAPAKPRMILIFSLAYHPFIGGAELAVKEITDRIDPALFSFHLITLRFDSTLPTMERIGNITVHRIGFSRRSPSPQEMVRFPLYLIKVAYPILAFFKARSLNKREPFSALWAVMAYAGFPAVLFKLFCVRRMPFLLTLQEGDSVKHMTGRWRIKLVWPLLRLVFKKATMVQAISSYLAQFAYDMGARAPIEVVPNGVDFSAFMNVHSPEEREALRRELSMREGEKYLITTSRLVEKNAIDDVIKALVHVPYNYKFLIVGEGPLRASLEKVAKEHGVAERVHFVGHIEHEKIPLYLSVSDVFIRSSRSEGMGSSFIEAMAAGLPVIATAVGGIPDFLEDYRTGFLVNVGDPQGIAAKVLTLDKEPALVREVVFNARQMVVARYDWNLIARMMGEIFERLCRREMPEWVIKGGKSTREENTVPPAPL